MTAGNGTGSTLITRALAKRFGIKVWQGRPWDRSWLTSKSCYSHWRHITSAAVLACGVVRCMMSGNFTHQGRGSSWG